jgi:hypothetical protein
MNVVSNSPPTTYGDDGPAPGAIPTDGQSRRNSPRHDPHAPFPSQLRLFARLPAHLEYLCHHHHWDTAVFDLINWSTFDACSRTFSFLKRLFVVNWTNDLLPFQEQQHRFNQSPSLQCPSSCGASENWRYFLRCSHPAHVVIWRECSRVIVKTFNTWHIDPSLRRLVLYWLARLSDANPIPLDNLSDEYLMLRTTQKAIQVFCSRVGAVARAVPSSP